MSRPPRIPPELLGMPFRASGAVAAGRITRSMLGGAEWRRLFPDVYAHRGTELDHRLWCRAALLAAPASAAIGGLSAGALWGAIAPAGAAPVHLVAPRAIRLRRDPRVVVHHTRLVDGDVTTRGGLRLTTPERTIFDLGRRADRVDALATLDAMLHRHLLDPDVLRRMIRKRDQWPRVDRLAALLDLAEPRAESPMETRLRLILADAGVRPAVAQFAVFDIRNELLARVDLAWPDLRLAVEYDGDQHRERDQFQRDAERLNALHLAGWTVLRFTAVDVLRRPDRTVHVVRAALAELNARRQPASRSPRR
jgi:hypothetical protein